MRATPILNPTSAPNLDAIPPDHTVVQCTFVSTGQNCQAQHYWQCKTCGLVNGKGVCDSCAIACHTGHELIDAGTALFYCDCGSGEGPHVCKCILPVMVKKPEPGVQAAQCTFAQSGKEMICQHHWHCKTCKLDGSKGICDSCAKICHAGHSLVDSGTSNFYCDCGHGEGPCPCRCLVPTPIPQPQAGELAQCSFSHTGKNMENQHIWRCKTCRLIYNRGVCDACAKICHQGHELEDGGSHPFYCDCGSGEGPCQCKCLVPTPIPPPLPEGTEFATCTYKKSGKTYILQKFFRCKTCGLVGGMGICEACAKICHVGHKLVEVGVTQAYCDCGGGSGPFSCKCLAPTIVPPQPEPEEQECEHDFYRGVCRECGEKICNVQGHTFSLGKCEYCGAKECQITGNCTNFLCGRCISCGRPQCEVTGSHNYVFGTCTICGSRE